MTRLRVIRKLEVMAKSLGLTMGELVRQGVDLVLCEKARLGQDPLVELIGRAGPAGRSDISAEHDAYQVSLSLESEPQ